MVVINENDYLAHYGILRKSGRYPWGSGKDVRTRNRTFLSMVDDLKKQGMKDNEIAEALGLTSEKGTPSSTVLIDLRSIAKNREKQYLINDVWKLADKGLSNGEIAKTLNLPGESSVRALKAPGVKERAEILTNTANSLRRQVDKEKMLDVGEGVELHMNISKTKLRAAVLMLKEEGYVVRRVLNPQLGTGNDTQMKVLAVPGTTWSEVNRNRHSIKLPEEVTRNGGKDWIAPREHPIVSVHPDRVNIVYKEKGGDKADGVIYVRPGVDDLSLGKSRYAQVRIMVGDSHYLKGMAMYNDDLPKGTDLLFHTAKSQKELGPNKLEAMKKLELDENGKVDKAFPFKTVVKPIILDQDGPNERRTAMNRVFEQGDWEGWSKSVSAQFLSKQSPALAKAQLEKTHDQRKREFDEIMSLTNPAVRAKLLTDFSEATDAASVHLEAARLHTEQRWHVILPIPKMKEHEVFAPNYDNGTKVVLVRYPHAGPFEIPELTVNNNHREAKKFLSGAKDAIGIHHAVAERLSGADFDGDTVIVIPNDRKKVRTAPALEGLKNFNPREQYKKYDGMKVISPGEKQNQMGKISNLITDMTLQGASPEQLTRAVRHSMVIIDSEKHELDYKRSAVDNGISALRKEYQPKPAGKPAGGASTLISRAGSPVHQPQTRPARVGEGGPINPITGEKNFVPTGKTRSKRVSEGVFEEVPRMETKDRLALERDAHNLVSDANTRMERIYADHSNSLKALANQSRLALLKTPRIIQNDSAKKVYTNEVESLKAQLNIAKMNAPLERRAQLVAGAETRAKREANPNMEKDTLKKVQYRELELARLRTGAGKTRVKITQREWDAIQAGAISNKMLNDILANTDIDVVKQYATPRAHTIMTAVKVERAQMMIAAGKTQAEIASQLGVSVSTLNRAMQGGE